MASPPVVLQAFTDGACSGNPGPGGWGAVLASSQGWARELGGGESLTTNNRMEMTAALEVLRFPGAGPGALEILTDSSYVVKGMTEWLPLWRRRGWRRPDGESVANRDLWEALDSAVSARRSLGPVAWRLVRGHRGIGGNERADQIAVAYSRLKEPELYDGPLSGYAVDLGVPESSTDGVREGRAVYLSLVDGRLERHATWPECSARIQGRPGARCRKVRSRAEEEGVLKSWGLSGKTGTKGPD